MEFVTIVDGAYIWRELPEDLRTTPLQSTLNRLFGITTKSIVVVDGDAAAWHGHKRELNTNAIKRAAWHRELDRSGVKLHLVPYELKDGASLMHGADTAIGSFITMFAAKGVPVAVVCGDADIEPAMRLAAAVVPRGRLLIAMFGCAAPNALRRLSDCGVAVRTTGEVASHA